MRYKPKSVAALHIALGGLPDNMRVEARAVLLTRAAEGGDQEATSLLAAGALEMRNWYPTRQ